ncbi:hypothetical protein [Kitasatospora sp. NPDC059327]|uniref:hypothetical protein n=1 Tax=Kitasatospora sp. NPDC059327 TaxID=3346803 RepID=UPI0036D1F35B
MRQTKTLPAAVQDWADQHTGRIVAVRDASHDWHRSRIWALELADGARRYVKVSPSVTLFTHKTRAYRGVVPALGHDRAPQLLDSRADELALLLTAAPGTPVPGLGLSSAQWRAVHAQAGRLCTRLHEASEEWEGKPYNRGHPFTREVPRNFAAGARYANVIAPELTGGGEAS